MTGAALRYVLLPFYVARLLIAHGINRYCVPLGLNSSPGYEALGSTDPLIDILPQPANATEVELRVQTFWLTYYGERMIPATGRYAFGLDDEDITQVFPGRLIDYETGVGVLV